jgi:hypothetical protein
MSTWRVARVDFLGADAEPFLQAVRRRTAIQRRSESEGMGSVAPVDGERPTPEM